MLRSNNIFKIELKSEPRKQSSITKVRSPFSSGSVKYLKHLDMEVYS